MRAASRWRASRSSRQTAMKCLLIQGPLLLVGHLDCLICTLLGTLPSARSLYLKTAFFQAGWKCAARSGLQAWSPIVFGLARGLRLGLHDDRQSFSVLKHSALSNASTQAHKCKSAVSYT